MTSSQVVIDQELAQFGWIESIATNSISDFKSPNLNFVEQSTKDKYYDLIDTLICHLIFYVIFCYSLFLYLFIDLGVGSFIKNKTTTFIKIKKKDEITSSITNPSYY